MHLKDYTRNALKSNGAGRIGSTLRYAAIPIGAIAGSAAYHTSGGDTASAANALFPAAIIFGTGEAIRVARDYAINGIGNIYQNAGRLASVITPAIAAFFLRDGAYHPIADLGPVAAWGIGQLPYGYGDRRQEKEIGYRILREGREKAIKLITELPDNELAQMAGKASRLRRK
jgi:hypothetical protein